MSDNAEWEAQFQQWRRVFGEWLRLYGKQYGALSWVPEEYGSAVALYRSMAYLHKHKRQ